MTIVENGESKYKRKLSLWPNVNGQVWVEIGMEQDDPMMLQGLAIDLDDAKVLLNELQRIIKEIED